MEIRDSASVWSNNHREGTGLAGGIHMYVLFLNVITENQNGSQGISLAAYETRHRTAEVLDQ